MMTRIIGPMWGCKMRSCLAPTLALLAVMFMPAEALAQSSAGGGGGGGGGGPVTQSGTWTVGLNGSLPAFAATPTFNLGTLNGAALDASVQAVRAALGSPFQAGGAVSVSNFPGSQAVTNAGTFAVQNSAATPAGANVIGSTSLRSAGTNRSASVTTTASTLMAANTGRQGWKVKNDCTVAVWVNFDATATVAPGSGNFQIPAGGYLSSEPGFVETGAMSAIAASGTCALTAREH
jgi:hypothetical protein